MLAQLARQIRARHGPTGGEGDEEGDGEGGIGQPIYIDDNCSVSCLGGAQRPCVALTRPKIM